MSLLAGESLQIIAYDRAGLATTCVLDGLRDQLESAQVDLLISMVDSLDEMSSLDQETPSLVLCVLNEPKEVRPTIAVLLGLESTKSMTKIVYLSNSLRGYAQVFREAGAQIVVDELLSLKRMIDHIAVKIPRSQLGTHPLTSGLSRRLPWEELDDQIRSS